MQSDKSFYVYLASNDLDYFDNTRSNFRVHLPRTVVLDPSRDWQTALVEVSYTYAWETISSDYRESIDQVVIFNINGKFAGVRITPGYFENIESLCERINENVAKRVKLPSGTTQLLRTSDESFATFENKVKGFSNGKDVLDFQVQYIKERNRVQFKLGKNIKAVYFNPTLRSILGLSRGNFLENGTTFGDLECDITAQVDSLYIYCDLLELQYVSNIMAPLLRVVPVPSSSKINDKVVITYDNPHYLSLSKSSFDLIHVSIRTAFGQYIPFTRGSVLLKLHIRPKPNEFFL